MSPVSAYSDSSAAAAGLAVVRVLESRFSTSFQVSIAARRLPSRPP